MSLAAPGSLAPSHHSSEGTEQTVTHPSLQSLTQASCRVTKKSHDGINMTFRNSITPGKPKLNDLFCIPIEGQSYSELRVTPPGHGTGLVCAQLGKDKVRGLGTVSIKHIHAVLWRSGLGTRPLARGPFSRLARHFRVVVVGDGAEQAEVGDGVISPHAAAVL